MYEKSREKVGKFINARDASEIVFVRGTTEAINLVAYSWGLNELEKNDEVLVSMLEHHSNIVPWEIVANLRGFKIKYANVHEDGTLDYEDFENKIGKKTKIVCLSQVSNVSGIVNDVKRIAKAAHDHGSLMLVDGAQSVPHMKVDVQDLDADFLAFSGHKMLGPTGIGALYGKKEMLKKMGPFQGGGEMIKDVIYNEGKKNCAITFNEVPWKFEAGTPDICGAVGLMHAIKYLEDIGMDEIFNHEKALTEYAIKKMKEFSKVTIHGPSDSPLKCGIIPFNIKGLSSHDIALYFDSYGIMVRSGYHCAQPLHQAFKLQSSARASFYIYNTNEEIDRFTEVLKEFEEL